MTLLNGIRKIFTETPKVPTIPKVELTSLQEQQFVGEYQSFKHEIEGYIAYKKKVQPYYSDLRIEQYKTFVSDVAKFVKTLDNNIRFQKILINVDGNIAFNLLDRTDLVIPIACRIPKIIPKLPQAIQENERIAQHLQKYETSQIRHLPLKFRNDPKYIYDCLINDELYKSPLPGIQPSNYRSDVIEAIGEDLKKQLDWYNYRIESLIEQLRVMTQSTIYAKTIYEKKELTKGSSVKI